MALQLEYSHAATVPLEVEGILPEHVRGKTLAEIEQLPIFHGNQQSVLGEFFRVSGDPDDARIDWIGDLSGVHWIGAKMTSGEMYVEGDAGRHVGSEMQAGTICVHGDAGDWVGGEMMGGQIHVEGRAGHLIGAAYRGSARGMTGGTILINGDAGNEIGHSMRRGLVAIGGNSGDLAGFNMLAGTLLFFGKPGIRHGAGMRRGTLGFFGESPEMLPTFRYACRYRPEFLGILLSTLRRANFPLPQRASSSPGIEVDLYHGDMIEGGRGEILLGN